MKIPRNLLCIIVLTNIPYFHCDYLELDLGADELLKKEIGDMPVMRREVTAAKNMQNYRRLLKTMRAANSTKLFVTSTSTGTSTPGPIPLTTAKTTKKLSDNNYEIVAARKKIIEIEMALRRTHNSLAELQNNTDGIEAITKKYRKFWGELVSVPWNVATGIFEEVVFHLQRVNYYYPENYNGWYWQQEKNFTITNMHHWIYRTQFNLIYVQKLRTKYVDHPRFKLGFCYALIRQLQNEQKMLYNAIAFHYMKHLNFYYHLRIYERISRLDIDIKDLIRYIKKLEYERKQFEDPTFYRDLPSSTPPGWR